MITCVYRKQEVAFSTFVDEFASLVERIVFQGDALLLVGDFKIWVDVEDDVKGKQLVTMMEAFGLSQQVHEPTQRIGHTLDHVFVNEFQLAIKHEVIREDMGLTTDHFPILLELPSSNIHE